MNTDTAALPEFAQPFVARLLDSRRDAQARVIKAPEGITLVRLSWTEARMMRGGYTEDREQVKWATWVGEKFVGSDSRKADALDYAAFVAERWADA